VIDGDGAWDRRRRQDGAATLRPGIAVATSSKDLSRLHRAVWTSARLGRYRAVRLSWLLK